MPKRARPVGIYTRPKSPYWWASYTDASGRATRRSTGVAVADDPDGRQAAAIRASLIADTRRERLAPDHTWDDLMLLYLEQVTPTKRAPERDYWSARALRPAFAGRRLSAIGAPEVRAYIKARQAAGIAPGTINKEVGLMSAACNWARRELEWDIANPWQARRQREPSGRQRWLTRAEAAALLAAAAALPRAAAHLPDFIRLGLYAGLRPGEILALEWERVDLRGNLIRFDADDQKSGKLGVVPLNAEARQALLNRARFRATHCPDARWVFCTRAGERLASVKRAFERAVAAAGLADVHPHDLRRTCGSWLVQSGIGIERVSAILRHSEVSITARVYAHLRPSDLADALAVLSQDCTPDCTPGSSGTKKPALTG